MTDELKTWAEEQAYERAKAEYMEKLDGIRAEIENDWQLKKYPSSPFSCGLRMALKIIDKYREGEDKECGKQYSLYGDLRQ